MTAWLSMRIKAFLSLASYATHGRCAV